MIDRSPARGDHSIGVNGYVLQHQCGGTAAKSNTIADVTDRLPWSDEPVLEGESKVLNIV